MTSEAEFCTALGPKRPGTDADRRMTNHVVERFRAAGLQTSTESFDLPVFQVERESIEVVAPKQMTVEGESFFYGGVGTVEAPVVYVGTGRASDYSGVDAKGKIVMVDRNEAYHRSSQLTEVVAHGGVAMLYVSGSPRNLVQTGAVRFAQDVPAAIPTLTVGANDGAGLKELARGGELRMRLTVDATRRNATAQNVIGVRAGTTYPDRYIVVGGHYDSWHGGAIDNCSGISSLLQIVEETKDVKPAYTIVFGAWDAEEVGIVGSYDWVMRHQDLMPRVVVNENLEMTSAATYVGDTRLPASLLNVMFGTIGPALNTVIYEAAVRNAFFPGPTTAAGVRAISGGIIPTDLQPFYTQGVQGFSTFSSTPYYHTVEDLADKIDPPSHVRVTNYLRDVLLDLQNIPPEALALREVPKVEVEAPLSARPGAEVPVEVTITDPAGRPLEGVPVTVLANQRDHWAVAHVAARELGGGRYAATIPAGATVADRTSLTATVSTASYAAQGYAVVDQSSGRPACRSRAGVSARAVRARGRTLRVAPPRGKAAVVRVHARRGRLVRAGTVARFRRPRAWRPRRLADGVYSVRIGSRRFTVVRRRGRFKRTATYTRALPCAPLRSFGAAAPVFGKRGVRLAYRLRVPGRVSIRVTRGRRTVRRVPAIDRAPNHTYRLRLRGRRFGRRGAYAARIVVRGDTGLRARARVVARRL